jgi:hypothetical protein
MTDRIDVVRTVPSRAHIEELAAVRHLSAHIEAAHSGLVNTNEVDPPVGDQAEPLIAVDEQLTHSEWCRRFLAKDLEPAHIFRRDRIFHIKRPALLDRPAELNRLVRRRTLMDVMDQADVIAELRPQGLEHTNGRVDIPGSVEDRRGLNAIRPQSLRPRRSYGTTHAIAGPSRGGQLNAHNLVSLLNVGLHLIVQIAMYACAACGISWCVAAPRP